MFFISGVSCPLIITDHLTQCITRALNFAKAKEEQARFHRALKIDQQLQQQEEEGRQGE